MNWLVCSAVAGVFLLAATIIFIIKMRPEVQPDDIVVCETPHTIWMTFSLVALAAAILTSQLSGMPMGDGAAESDAYSAAFSFFCIVIAAFSLLFGFLKKTVANDREIVQVDLLGKKTHIYWDEITQVKSAPMSKAITLVCGKGAFTINGEAGRMMKFVALARKHLLAQAAGDIFTMLDGQASESPLLRKRK